MRWRAVASLSRSNCVSTLNPSDFPWQANYCLHQKISSLCNVFAHNDNYSIIFPQIWSINHHQSFARERFLHLPLIAVSPNSSSSLVCTKSFRLHTRNLAKRGEFTPTLSSCMQSIHKQLKVGLGQYNYSSEKAHVTAPNRAVEWLLAVSHQSSLSLLSSPPFTAGGLMGISSPAGLHRFHYFS